jgi:7-cyano-7-deazaguanine synthase
VSTITQVSNTAATQGSVILLSGGIESSTLLHDEARRGEMLYPLFIDYAQRAAQQEFAAAEHQCRQLGLALKHLDLSAAGEAFRAGQEKRLHVPIPHRNLTLLSLSLSWAAQMRARRLLLALNREDTAAYPSAGTDFLTHFRAIARTLADLDCEAPYIELGKAEVIERGVGLGVDYTHTYSCLLGYELACGACPQCEKRRAAFENADQPDPTRYRPATRVQ